MSIWQQVLMSDVVPSHTMRAGSSVGRYQSTVAEWALFTSCDRFVITDSGFSKTSIMYSLSVHNTWVLPRLPFGRVTDVYPTYACPVEAPTDLELFGSSWSGI